MCGLAALIQPGRRFPARLLAAMEKDLFHRGPDSGGTINEPGVALVFRRLAILDPSAVADQPMTDPSGRCTLVYNGEIYNYRALQAALRAAGVTLKTDGDTEVVLQGYLKWGEGLLDRIEGMYAFAILDRAAGTVVAARDPFGIKPLYLRRQGRMVAMASEMRPLLRLGPVRPDPVALAELLTFKWAAGRLSNLDGIERIPGGTVLTVSLADGAVRERRFCDPLDTLRPDPDPGGDDDARTRVARALKESVTAHLASDVGYTVQLSGGVDSSLVTALASAAPSADRLKSFAVNLGDYVHDESAYRSSVVARYKLDHHEIPLNGVDFADALPRAVRHLEGPSPHFGCVMLMLLCDRIREVSKVVLTGEGADEMFGGYMRYGEWRKLRWQERIGRLLPARLWPPVRPFAGVRRLAGRDAAVYAALYRSRAAVYRIFPALVPPPGPREEASRRFRDFRDRLYAADQTAYLESLLVRQDKMAMAASLEARVPFVHLPLARVVNALPRDLRTPGGITKPVLKTIAEPFLPHDLIYRRKVGLLMPIDEWLADPAALGRYLDDLTAPDCRLAEFGERRHLSRLVATYRAGDRRQEAALVDLINIETWLRGLPAGAACSST